MKDPASDNDSEKQSHAVLWHSHAAHVLQQIDNGTSLSARKRREGKNHSGQNQKC
jgi:hypothetical protein